MLPLVSIMIPTYKQESFILDAVQSALAQDYQNLEVVVCDDASPDRTFDRAAALDDPRLRVFRNDANLGRTRNYQHLLKDLARGQWALMLDADDYLVDPTYIRLAVNEILRHPACVLVGAGYRAVGQNGVLERLPATRPTVLDGQTLFLDWHKKALGHQTALYRRELAASLDFYCNDRQSADWESLLQIMLFGQVVLLPRIVSVWRDHGGNESRRLDYEAFITALACFERPEAVAVERGLDRKQARGWKQRHIQRQLLNFFLMNLRGLGSRNSERAREAQANLTRLRREFPPLGGTGTVWAAAMLLHGVLGSSILRFLDENGKRLFRGLACLQNMSSRSGKK